MAEAVTSLDWFLNRVRERTRRIVEASQQPLTPICFICTGQRNGFTGDLMVPLTVPDSLWRLVLTKHIRRYHPLAYALVAEVVSTVDLDAVKYGMETIPKDDQEEEIMIAIVQRGRQPKMEMGKIKHTTQGRRLEAFREMKSEAAFFEENLVLKW